MSQSSSVDKKVNFEPIIEAYEHSLRGNALENKKWVKKFPESAGSVFISKWVGKLRTILIGVSAIGKLKEKVCKRRILANSTTFIINMITDETISAENMAPLSQGFNNILVDSYFGLRQDGHLGNLIYPHEDDRLEDDYEPEGMLE